MLWFWHAGARPGFPRDQTAVGWAMSVLIVLVRKGRDQFILAIAIKVRELDMGAAAGSGECPRRCVLSRERSFAIAEVDHCLASRGQSDQVLVSVAFEVASCERDRALASLCREERPPIPVSTRPRK